MNKINFDLLEKGIDAGYYLPKDESEDLPSTPQNNTEEIEAYHEKCQGILDSYKLKLQVYEQKEKAAIEAAKAKNMVDMANALIVDFDEKLSAEYESHKKESELMITKLRDDLTESKDISSRAIKRCDELSLTIKQLEAEKKKLNDLVEEKEAEIAYYESDFSNNYVLEIDGKFAGCATLNKKAEIQKESNLQDEIEKLKSQLSDAEAQGMSKAAAMMIEGGFDFLSNIDVVKENKDSAFGETVLKHSLSGVKDKIGQQDYDKLRLKIGDISDQREKVQEEQRHNENERNIALKQQKVFKIDVKQMNGGTGTFLEMLHDAETPKPPQKD